MEKAPLGIVRYPDATHPCLRGRIEQMLAPGSGFCFCCGRPWTHAIPHETPYKSEHANHGCFPLCEDCWAKMQPGERWPYYKRLVDLWIGQNPGERERYEADRLLIREAVLNGR